MLKNVGLANFTGEVIQQIKPVLVDFYSNGCGPCRQIKPVLEAVAAQGHTVVAVDVENEPELTEYFGVQSLPTIIQFKDGKAGNRVIGVKTEKELLRLLAS